VRGVTQPAPELVIVTIDERQVQVPKGTGMVETAAAAGIEIPVFCYEPRLGPPVGACRMCLVEVEGMPKLQAGCTLTALDGMVVKTARSSAQAAEGQNSTLEFILVNHPLDCPVCDKGGECPLQDLTFRYGPGNTRMTFPKRTMEKPIPISPLIALDRERCILCYRCTRFSESVAEDGQLVAINRGSQSVIATFEDEPYKGHFSGNVTEICPVGALTSTQYRFEARPWEIQSVPSVCGMCPVGCNVNVTTREGKVKRIQSRNHPEIDEGWLCDKGRFAYAHLDAPDRITAPLRKAGPRRFEAISWDDAIERAAELLRTGGATTVTALSGGESVEEAYALAKLMRRGLGAHNAVLTEEPSEFGGSPLSALREAKSIAVLCDVPVVERAPIVDLWLKAARRAGGTISYDRPTAGVDALVTDDPANVGLVDATHVYVLPFTPNGRGVADAWSAAGDEDPVDEPPRVLLISGDEAATNDDVRALAAEAEIVIGIGLFEESFRSFADLVLPGTSYLERDGTTVNLEGRLQRQRRAVLAPVPDVLAWLAKLGERFGVDISPHASVVFDEISERCYGGVTFADLGERAPLPPRAAAPETPPTPPSNTVLQGKGLRLIAYKPLFSGAAVERTPELQFQRPDAEVELSAEDAKAHGIRNGSTVTVASNGTSVELRARIARDLAAGAVRIAQEHATGLHPIVELKA
jgi:NADH dehydrogenase/NADH:ubiquinone oxidoreductase subunit G